MEENVIDSPTSIFQWGIKWIVLKEKLGCQIVERSFDKWKHGERDVFCLPLKDKRKTPFYPRVFETRLRGKHGEQEHKKAIRDVQFLKNFRQTENTTSESCTPYYQKS